MQELVALVHQKAYETADCDTQDINGDCSTQAQVFHFAVLLRMPVTRNPTDLSLSAAGTVLAVKLLDDRVAVRHRWLLRCSPDTACSACGGH